MVYIYEGFGTVWSRVFRQIWHPIRCDRSRNRALVFIITVDDVVIDNVVVVGVIVVVVVAFGLIMVVVSVVIVLTVVDIAYGLSLIQIHERYVIIFIIFL